VRQRRPLLIAGLGVVGAMEAHGLTDQVVTTNIGTGMLLLACAAVFASLTDESLARLGRWTLRGSVAMVGVCAVGCLALLVTPGGRAQTLLDIGGLKMNQAFALPSQSPARAADLADAEAVLSQALGQDSGHPAVLRDLAWVRAARFDDR